MEGHQMPHMWDRHLSETKAWGFFSFWIGSSTACLFSLSKIYLAGENPCSIPSIACANTTQNCIMDDSTSGGLTIRDGPPSPCQAWSSTFNVSVVPGYFCSALCDWTTWLEYISLHLISVSWSSVPSEVGHTHSAGNTCMEERARQRARSVWQNVTENSPWS